MSGGREELLAGSMNHSNAKLASIPTVPNVGLSLMNAEPSPLPFVSSSDPSPARGFTAVIATGESPGV